MMHDTARGRSGRAARWSEVSWGDNAMLAIVVFVIALATFHPYFFGDEIGALHVAAYERSDFWKTFQDLNTYKPRLLFNGMWALFGVSGALRFTVMSTFALGMFVSAAVLYRLTFKATQGSRGISWLAVGVLVTSRFGAMLYYDYLSGTIETWSLALFLTGMVCLFDSKGDIVPSLRRLALGCLLFTAAVFVHERYLVVVAVAGVFLALRGVERWRDGRTQGRSEFAFGAAVVALPLLAFVLATHAMSVNPVLTGTAGRAIRINFEIIQSGLAYLANLLLGFNFGKPWFVGGMNQDSLAGKAVFAVFGVAFVLAWLIPLWRRHVASIRGWTPMLLWMCLALIGVASLTGLDRQEARWMLPVQALLILLVVQSYRSRARVILLLLMLLANVVYVGFGPYWGISSIQASRSARELATMLNKLPANNRGFIANDITARWTLTGGPYIHNTGVSARVFCSVNVASGACMDAFADASDVDLARYDFGVVAAAPAAYGRPQYGMIKPGVLEMVKDARSIPEGVGKYVGHGPDWSGWRWSAQPPASEEGIVLLPGVDGFVEMDVRELAGKIIIYRASSLGDATVPMRLQVNWHSSEGAIGATLEVANVGPVLGNHAALLTPPTGALTGLVYASVHGSPRNGVMLQSIRLVDQKEAVDASGLRRISEKPKDPSQ